MTAMMLGDFETACGEFKAILLIDPDHEKNAAADYLLPVSR